MPNFKLSTVSPNQFARFLGLFLTLSAAVANAAIDLPQVPAGLRAELFAREPLVRNPCAMAFDARGRLFVGHGPQYRNPTPDTPPDRVSLLIDTNGDGVADTAKTFATGFNTIQGLAWRGRDLWVANSPDLTIVRDLDGDDEADEYILVYTDLGNLEHGIQGLNWAPDGKLYFSKGNSKGLTQPGRIAPRPFRELWDVRAPDGAPDFPPPRVFKKGEYKNTYQDPRDDWGREGGVLRCDNLGANLEIVSRGLRNPWDIGFDSGFNWLGTDNDQGEGDRVIMPFFGAHFGWGHRWSAHWTGHDHLPTVPVSGPVFHGSGTGIVFYDLPQLPPAYRGVWFINDFLRRTTFMYRPDWHGALMMPAGGAWEEFARGRDALFKPVDMQIGPEGALYMTGWGAELAVVWRDGEQANEGRVFRISWPEAPAANWPSPKRARPLHQWRVAELIEDLGAALPVWRVDAQDELVRRGIAVRDELVSALDDPDLTEAQQTWILWALGRIAPQDRSIDAWLAAKVTSGGFNTRLQAIRILAHRIREHRPGDRLAAEVVAALKDGEPRLRFAAAQAIQQARQSHLVTALAAAAATERDRVTFYAMWRALREVAPAAELETLLKDPRGGVRRAALLALLDRGTLAAEAVAAMVGDPDPQTAAVAALWQAKRQGNPLIVIEPAPRDFTDRLQVKLTPGLKPGAVRYTLDGSEPTQQSLSSGRLELTETTTIKAALFVNSQQVGPTAEATWRKRPPAEPVTLTPPPIATTVEAVLAALEDARPENGRAVFNAAGCYACHRVGDEGGVFGPELTGFGDRGNLQHLIRSILYPNEAITEGYALLNVQTRDGAHAGIMREETDRVLVLVQPDGQPLSIDKSSIVSRESLHTSPMPPYDNVLAPGAAADVVAWLMADAALSSPVAHSRALAARNPALQWEWRENGLLIRGAGRPIATYVYHDDQILRPYFQNLHAPDGNRITRRHPAGPPDATDHATMHPGLWLAFGDINGADFWRNKARIEHVRFVDFPRLQDGRLRFATENRLVGGDGQGMGTQISRFTVWREGDANWIGWDATFRPADRELVFGEQEEMGLGIRMTGGLIERNGPGIVVNSDGLRGARAVWGKVADWAEYSAVVDGRRMGAAIFPSPHNPYRSWWHSRDYGAMVANPFGPRVLPEEAGGKLVVKPGEELRLRFGVRIFSTPASNPVDSAAAYRDFVREDL